MRYLVVLLLAGCAGLTPDELRQSGDKSQHFSREAPRKVANCLARNAEEFRPALGDHLSASVREPAEGAFDVMVRGSQNHNFAIAWVNAWQSGSRVWIWLAPHYAYKSGLREAMVRGC